MWRMRRRCAAAAAVMVGTCLLLPATGQDAAPAEADAQNPPAATEDQPAQAAPATAQTPAAPMPPNAAVPQATEPPPAAGALPPMAPNATPPALEGDAAADFAGSPLARTLQEALAPQFPGVQIVLAQPQADGTLALYGVLPSPDFQPQVEKAAVAALQNQQVPGLPGPVGAVDASRMRPHIVPAVEQILPIGSEGVMVVQSINPDQRHVALAGWVASPAAMDRVRQLSQSWTVDATQVVTARMAARPVQAATFAYAMATDAMGRSNGPGIIYAANHVIQHGAGQVGLVARAWYLRAAGHILMNDIPAAKADLKVALAMDVPDPGLSIRFQTLHRFQGYPRFLLESYVSEFDQPVPSLGQLLAPPAVPTPQPPAAATAPEVGL